MQIKSLTLQGFKAFNETCNIDFSNLEFIFGANSSGKSTIIQSLLLLKQTIESRSTQFDLIPNGKFINLGSPDEFINNKAKDNFSISLELTSGGDSLDEVSKSITFNWGFVKSEKRNNGIALEYIDVVTDAAKFYFEHNSKSGKFVNKDGDALIKSIVVSDLIPITATLLYKESFNKLAHKFYWELCKICSPSGFQLLPWDKTLLFVDSAREISDKLRNIKEYYLSHNAVEDSSNRDSRTEVRDELLQFSSELDEKVFATYRYPDPTLQVYYISIYLDKDKLNSIGQLIQKYKVSLDEIESTETDDFRSIDVPLKGFFFFEKFSDILELGNSSSTLEETIKKITYLGPIRESPSSFYEHDTDTNPTYVGKTGQHIASIMAYYSNYNVELPCSLNDNTESCVLTDALDFWMNHLGVAEKINFILKNYISITVEDLGVVSSITNVGVGVSQVLPVIAMGLLSKRDDILIFEQPELHLNPKVQTRLIDFFVALIKNGRQVIIETHSEYFIHKLRYLLLQEDIDESLFNVMFISKSSDGINTSNAVLGKFGQIDFPEEYKDTTEELTDDLLNMRLERLSKTE